MTPRKSWFGDLDIRTFKLFLFVYWLYGVAAYSLIALITGEHPPEVLNVSILKILVVPFGMILGLVINIVLHELSHAGAAMFLGQLLHIQIGRGRHVTTRKICGLRWVIKASPDCGFIYWGVTSLKWARLRHLGVSLAGPICTLIIFLGLWHILARIPSNSWSFMPTAYLPYFAGGVFGATCLLMVGAWLPFYTKIDGKQIQTDMLSILNLGKLTEPQLQAEVTFINEYSHFYDEWPMSIDTAKRLAAENPQNALLLYMAATVIREAQDTQYLTYLRKALTVKSPSPKHRITLLDEYLTGTLEYGLAAAEPNADEWSKELLEIHHDKITAKGTRGGILIDLGRLEEGQAVLQEVVEKTESTLDKAYSNVFLALAEKERGNLDLARDYAKKAIHHDPNCQALKRISDLLQPSVA